MTLSVILPAYQAGASIAGVVAEVTRTVPDATVFVVDDGSTDGTAVLGQGAGATVLRHVENRGKGAALRTGIAASLSAGARIIATIDADGQHDVASLPRLLDALEGADIVVGARERGTNMPPHRRVTNRASSAAVSRITGQQIADAQSGFRVFTRAVAERVQPSGSGYEFETEFLVLAARAGFRVSSVPVPTIYAAPSHFRLIRDGAAVIRTIWALRR